MEQKVNEVFCKSLLLQCLRLKFCLRKTERLFVTVLFPQTLANMAGEIDVRAHARRCARTRREIRALEVVSIDASTIITLSTVHAAAITDP